MVSEHVSDACYLIVAAFEELRDRVKFASGDKGVRRIPRQLLKARVKDAFGHERLCRKVRNDVALTRIVLDRRCDLIEPLVG